MTKYLIDANLPFKIGALQNETCEFVTRIDRQMSDSDIWEYAKQRNLTIVTKDADFSHRIIVSDPPPKVIHIRFGNMRLKEFISTMESMWEKIEQVSEQSKLTNVFLGHIEAVK